MFSYRQPGQPNPLSAGHGRRDGGWGRGRADVQREAQTGLEIEVATYRRPDQAWDIRSARATANTSVSRGPPRSLVRPAASANC